MLSSLLFALIWGTRKLLGRLSHAGPLSLRILPLGSTVLFFALTFLFKSTLNNLDLATFGLISLRTVTIMLLSIAFSVVAAASIYVAYRARSVPMNRVAYWHSVLVALAVAAAAAYMGYWGLIGLCLWA